MSPVMTDRFACSREKTVDLLHAWTRYADRWLYRLPGSDGLICYGTGAHGHWALQAHDTAFTGYAMLATIPANSGSTTHLSREACAATALALCRYTFQSHHVGGGTAADGQTWGHSWISTLGLERMMHGVRAIRPVLTDADQERMRRVLLSEADWLLTSYPVTAGLTKNNHPESNMWNGTFLYRIACLYPDAPHAADYRVKGTSFLANAISFPEDATDERLLDGRPLQSWHIGPNFTSTYGCNHHGYMNIGYMAITLSNLAMFHFTCKEEGWDPPEALYLHAREVWQVLKTCTFPDGRLWRIGGDSRVRYCYCQDYAIPVWCFARDYFGDADAARFHSGWMRQVATEAATNGDGSFLGRRLQRLETVAPLYTTRLEGDRVCSLAMALAWGPVADTAPLVSEACPTFAAWSDDLHGTSVVREEKRFASWTWLASEPPQGMCLPPDGSDLAEWRHGLSGQLRSIGIINTRRIIRHADTRFDGGFATCGRVTVTTDVFIGEGENEDTFATIDLAFAALPDGRTVVGMQHASLAHRAFVRECKGLYLLLPNDCFNGYTRRMSGAGGAQLLQGRPLRGGVFRTGGRWLAIDDRLGVVGLYGGDEIVVNQPQAAQIDIRSWKHQSHAGDPGGLLYADEVCFGACSDTSGFVEGGTLFDIGFAVRTAVTAAETAAWSHTAAERLATPDALRAVRVTGADGHDYLVAAHFGEPPETFRLTDDGPSPWQAVDGGPPFTRQNGTLSLTLEPGTTRVFSRG